MAASFRPPLLLPAAPAAVACGESSPTAPSSIDATAPTAVSTTMPTPAPVSQTLTGTWTGAGQTFTVTQNGASATGMIAPASTSVGDGITLTESTTINGSVSGANVTLQMNDRIAINGRGATVNCTAGHNFPGPLSA